MLRDILLFGAGAFMTWLFLKEPFQEDNFKAASDHLEKAKGLRSKGLKDEALLNEQEASLHMKLLSDGERKFLKKEFGVS